jgi:glycosyltransferase involved in cell wall biosynthesis
MACGAPVVAAHSGGVVDTVVHEVNGLFFDPDHPAEVGQMVRRLKEDPDLRAKLSANAVQHAQSRSWRATMDQLVGYYRTAMRLSHQGRLAQQLSHAV